MTTIARTSGTHDLYLDSTGQIAIADGIQCYSQTIESAILTVIGEIQLDTKIGIPYFTTIFESKRFLSQWASSVLNRVSEMPFTTIVENFDYEYINGSLVYNMTVQCGDEPVTVNIANSINSQIVIPDQGHGGIHMETLTDSNGNFYLPVQKVDGVQRYRMLTVFVDPTYGNSTQVSSASYIRNQNGEFVEV